MHSKHKAWHGRHARIYAEESTERHKGELPRAILKALELRDDKDASDTSDGGCPSVCYEYVFLSLVTREAVSANDLVESCGKSE